jgi:hypothetical protein
LLHCAREKPVRVRCEGEIDAFGDLVNDSFGDEDLDVDVRVFPLEVNDDWRQERVGNAGRRR